MSKKKKYLDSFSDLRAALTPNNKIGDGIVADYKFDATKDTNASPRLKGASKKDQILEYTCYGAISRCTNRGFGFFEGPDGDEWFHITDKQGERVETLEGLEGKNCVFVKGGAPFGFKQSKSGWDRSVVKWQLAQEIDVELTSSNFRQLRMAALRAATSRTIDSLLLAKWYLNLWHKKAGITPQVVLKADELLDQALKSRLKDADELGEIVQLLVSIVHSPWYAINPERRQPIFERFFEPEHWSPRLFQTGKSFSSIPSYHDLESIAGKAFTKHARRVNTVAIDLETDRETIYQFGWKNTAGSNLRSSNVGLSSEELHSAIEESLNGTSAPTIVGHNLIKWDWPILNSHKAAFPDSSRRWDTLVASWLLDPWRESHALVVAENAHRADADAAECHSLYEAQVERLAPLLAEQPDIEVFVDRLFEDPSQLSLLDNRTYPKSKSDAWEDVTIISRSRARTIAWHSGGRIEFFTPEFRLNDPTLSPDLCQKFAVENGGLFAKLVYIIVADAAAHNVQVRLSCLPLWLIDVEFEQLLRDSHLDFRLSEQNPASHVFHLAEDLFQLDDDEVERVVTAGRISIADPEESALVWQRLRRRHLTGQEVQERYPNIAERAVGRALFSVPTDSETSAWLLFEPPGLNTDQRSWFLLPRTPRWLKLDSDTRIDRATRSDLGLLPRWRDGELERLDIDRIFVLPDTANRALYLADLMHSVLNLIRQGSNGETLIVGLRWHEEAQKLQRDLELLELSHGHPGSPLRRLEYLQRRGANVLACARNEIPQFVSAAKNLGVKIRVAIDEVPLHDWYALLNEPALVSNFALDEPGSEIWVGDDRKLEGATTASISNVGIQKQPAIRGPDLVAILSRFLDVWMADLVGDQSCLILDTRLVEAYLTRTPLFKSQDISFYALEELLDKHQIQIFNEICHPKPAEHQIPNDYESYKNFLKAHWGFDDFRPGTQQPAIRKIIDTDRDMLIRLPTGAGKSVIFHLPALLRSFYSQRLTVVITPLRALMRDQAEGLWSKHFSESVDYLSGGRDPWINKAVYQGVLDGRIKLIFIAPERFRVPLFTDVLERRRRMDDGLEFVVFDEAHCISEWGFEFRPDYLHAAQYVAKWFKEMDLPGNPHRLLLTSATVTQRNRTDLEKELGLGKEQKYEELPEDMPHPIQPYILLESYECDEDETAPTDEKLEKIADLLASLDLKKSAALIFAPRRRDCHRIADWLNESASHPDSAISKIQAIPFHAGLPESAKEEAVELLKRRQINVLVCTKAFGMGMDIPHLHACIHYLPPSYIEDYLQEVGRIGRDERERIESGHQKVTATLLYNASNINRNLGFVHDEAVKPPDLQDFFSYCLEQSIAIGATGSSICFVPQKMRLDNKKEFSESKVSKSLFWLERMRVVRVEGQLRSDLQLRVELNRLKTFSDGEIQVSQVAKCLLQMLDSSIAISQRLAGTTSDNETKQTESTHLLGRLVKGILKGILALTSAPSTEPTVPRMSLPEAGYKSLAMRGSVSARVSIRDLIASSGASGIDDLFAALFKLHKSKAIFVDKTFRVSKPSAPSCNAIWELIDQALSRLLKSTGGQVEHLPKKLLEDSLSRWYLQRLVAEDPELANEIQNIGVPVKFERQISREVYRAVNTAMRILGLLRFEVPQRLSETGELNYIRAISDTGSTKAKRGAEDVLRLLKKFHEVVLNFASANSENTETFSFPLTEIVESLGGDIRVRQLEQLMTLLERAGLYRFEGSLEESGTLISINTKEPLERHQPETQDETLVQRVYNDVLKKNELQELRALAMVLLTVLPPEDRKDYIDKYFNCMVADEITKLLEDTVGNVDEEVLNRNQLFQDLLGQVRKDRFAEEIARLNKNQLATCRAPFDTNLLVNAGPGSGKTHVLMMRCAHLIHVQQVDPSQILVLAFNRAVVHEIRDRIRSLFRALGYGNYANKLDVSTFHSFALRYQQANDQYQEEAIGEAVHHFAEKISTDQAFAKEVGGTYRAILIDEFQDMNEDFYRVVVSLLENCKGGGMVIGDDDQDILTWNRRKWQKQYRMRCPLDATHYFELFRDRLKPNEFELTLNYRSVPIIVEQSIKVIENVSSRIGFARMKDDTRLIATRSETGLVTKGFDPSAVVQIVNEALSDGDSVGVLCRSNRECRKVYEQLMSAGVDSEQVDLLGSQDFPLYQLRHPGAFLDICGSMNDYEFVEKFIWEEMIEQFSEKGLADINAGLDYLNILYELTKVEVGRPRVRDISSFIKETRASDVERLKAKIGLIKDKARLTVATVHKVKGLQFDTVLVVQSEENFPFQNSNGQTSEPEVVDSAEEARLYYVAMTRARNRLYFGWGTREKSWYARKRYSVFDGTRQFLLNGSPKQIFVSWAGRAPQVGGGLQEYVERQVRLGDKLTLLGRDYRHENRVIGRLSNPTVQQLGGEAEHLELRVSNVIRYTCGRYFREHNPKFWEPLAENIKSRGWFYAVLVEEGR